MKKIFTVYGNDRHWLAFSSVIGSTGGILIMWSTNVVQCQNVITNEVTLSCLFSNNNSNFWYCFAVYCRGNFLECFLLEEELLNIKNTWGVKGLVGCDFNMILRSSERSGCNYSNIDIDDFRALLDKLNLNHLPLKGGRWTWSN